MLDTGANTPAPRPITQQDQRTSDTQMITDARSVPDGTVIDADVCIVGGGAAGISLAREFVDSGHQVVLLESGGMGPDPATQELYSGSDIGRPYEIFPVSRFRYLGGTTNGWGGAWCDLPSDLDLEERAGFPHSGWPFSFAEVEPWYHRAHPILRLGPFGYALSDWGIAEEDIPEAFRGPDLVCRVLQQAPTTRFGRHYAPDLRRAENLTVYLNANALNFETDETTREVRRVNVGVIPNGRFAVSARFFVLSCGGIENARLLLLSKDSAGVGLGNGHDLVGRYFMLHLEYTGGTIKLRDPHVNLSFQTGENGAQYRRFGATRRFVSYIAVSEETKRRLDLPAARFRFVYPRSPELDVLWRIYHRKSAKGEFLKDLKRVLVNTPSVAIYIVRRILYGRNKPPKPLHAVPLKCTAEQVPNPHSRITLGEERDRFGLPKVVVDWQLTEADRRGILAANGFMAAELERTGFGTFESAIPEGESAWPRDLRGDQHHMGTTRMHRDPKQGVVDETCRVHGVGNLYVAGSSVFPTGGTFNPTLTIIALALRVADKVKERLAQGR